MKSWVILLTLTNNGDEMMAKMYYVCNHVDKVEIQFATLDAAKVGYDYAVDEMVKKVHYMFGALINVPVRQHVSALFYIRQVDYVREEIIYDSVDLVNLQGVEENE
jgi:hypothetical protein